MIHILTYHRAGLFSNFLAVLAKLKECEKIGVKPIVFWGKYCHSTEQPNPYFEEKYGQNVWEYYFEPVSSLRYNDVESRLPQANIKFISSPKIFRCDDNASIRQTANYYIKKYIRLKPRIIGKFESYYNRYMQNKHVLGIHMRGTDRISDASPAVQRCSPPSTAYMKQIDKYLKANPEAIIFVATDSDILLKELKQEYPNRVICYDSIRSDNNYNSAHWSPIGSPYKKGEGVLVECLLLSKCNFLIRSISNVSTASLYFNPELRQINIAELYYDNRTESFIDQTYLDWADRFWKVRWSILRAIRGTARVLNI